MSPHKLHVFLKVYQRNEWATAKQVSDGVVAPRTARHHLRALADEGLLECIKSFGGYRYRVPEDADVSQIRRWAEVYGVAKI